MYKQVISEYRPVKSLVADGIFKNVMPGYIVVSHDYYNDHSQFDRKVSCVSIIARQNNFEKLEINCSYDISNSFMLDVIGGTVRDIAKGVFETSVERKKTGHLHHELVDVSVHFNCYIFRAYQADDVKKTDMRLVCVFEQIINGILENGCVFEAPSIVYGALNSSHVFAGDETATAIFAAATSGLRNLVSFREFLPDADRIFDSFMASLRAVRTSAFLAMGSHRPMAMINPFSIMTNYGVTEDIDSPSFPVLKYWIW